MLLAIVVGVLSRLWPAVAVVSAGVVLYLTGAGGNSVVAMLLAVVLGVSIGLLTGFLVASVGIPSFVVTLALFLAWQGVLLKFIGTGNAIPVRQEPAINGLANRNLPVTLGWLFFALIIGTYGAYTVWRSFRRRAQQLSAEPLALVVMRLVALAVLGGLVVWLLSEERGPNPALRSIKGVPYVVALIILLMVFWALVLGKSAFGRHLYAVGGNAEAARRAGINVPRIRTAAFAISSGMAGLGGVVLASRAGGVPADLGGGNTLLYAVGAAVIGGTSLFGGRGKVRDAVLGGIVIAMIPNGLGLVGLGADYNFIITGLVLLVAASVDALSRKRAAATGR
jgi:D-xylose transport system permease protein